MVAAHAFRTVPIESQAPDRGGCVYAPAVGRAGACRRYAAPIFQESDEDDSEEVSRSMRRSR